MSPGQCARCGNHGSACTCTVHGLDYLVLCVWCGHYGSECTCTARDAKVRPLDMEYLRADLMALLGQVLTLEHRIAQLEARREYVAPISDQVRKPLPCGHVPDVYRDHMAICSRCEPVEGL